ncbi:MAG TPA: glycosyltransferase family 9 protein, partial [Ktedonobacteraceae bacterium]|nr:glycosyltransferase family 9 protein [Ktedonobacteraceae bacterium]
MKIVAIRPAPLGDSLLVFPILAALRAKYTTAHITFLGHPAVLPLAKAWGVADEALNPAQLNWSELVSPKGIRSANLRELLQGADLVICWLDDSDGWVSGGLRGIGVEQFIIAPEGEPLNNTRHIVEVLAGPLGLPPIGTGFVVPANGWNNGFCPYNLPIAIHPGCSEENRRWPTASFAAVINELLRKGYPVLLLAGPSDVEVLKEVRKHLAPVPKSGLLSVLQDAPLLELAKSMQHSRGFLGNDSGISHL